MTPCSGSPPAPPALAPATPLRALGASRGESHRSSRVGTPRSLRGAPRMGWRGTLRTEFARQVGRRCRVIGIRGHAGSNSHSLAVATGVRVRWHVYLVEVVNGQLRQAST